MQPERLVAELCEVLEGRRGVSNGFLAQLDRCELNGN